MPVPMMNIINGGAHANNSLDIQEFMILPVGAPSLREALRYGAEIFHTLKKILNARGMTTAVGDEGGFAPDLPSNEAALLDHPRGHRKRRLQGRAATSTSGWTWPAPSSSATASTSSRPSTAASRRPSSPSTWPIWSRAIRSSRIEDGMSEGDWAGWSLLTQALGSKLQLVGDDLFVTNTRILAEGISKGVANAILIKPNQIGTLTETLAAITMAEKAHYASIVSHRSGETEDTHHRRYRGGDRGDADQDRFDVALGSHRQVQPAAAHRGDARRRAALCGARCVSVGGTLASP